jgi:amino acid transporter
MASEVTAPSSALGGKKVLGLPSVIAQSIGFVGPVFSATFLLPSVAGLNNSGKGAGVASPLAVLIATIGLGGVAWIMSRYAKRVHHAGAVYEYVNNGFGSRVGFLGGWIYYGGMLGLATAIFPAFGGFLNGTLNSRLGIDVPWLVLALLCIAVVTAMVVIGIELSVRLQLVIATVSILVIFGFALKVILTGGPAGNSADAFNPSAGGGSGLLFGLVYACLAFTGFESAANLAEETGNPGRNIPRAMLGCLGLVGVFYTVVMYAMVSAFGFDMDKFAGGFPQLLVAASTPGTGGDFFGALVDWIIIIDVFAVALGVATAISRGMFAMARDGHLPKVFAGVHSGLKTPIAAAAFVAALSVAICVAAQVFDGIVAAAPAGPDGAPGDPGPWFRIFQWEAAWGALGLIIVYAIVALSGFKSHPGESRVGTGIAAVLGLGASGAAIFGTVYKAPPAFNLDSVWWVMVIWIVIGLVVMVVNPNAAQLGERR